MGQKLQGLEENGLPGTRDAQVLTCLHGLVGPSATVRLLQGLHYWIYIYTVKLMLFYMCHDCILG